MRFSEKFKVIGDIRPLDYSDAEIQHDVMSWVLELENMFGPATDEMSFGGVYFNASDNDGPCIYYPYDYPREVMVQLVGLALRDKNVARFQLAHEMVHCLSPSGKVSAKVFEEGAAAWYQQRLSTKEMNGIVMLGNPRYMAACKLYMKLCKKNKDANMERNVRMKRTGAASAMCFAHALEMDFFPDLKEKKGKTK